MRKTLKQAWNDAVDDVLLIIAVCLVVLASTGTSGQTPPSGTDLKGVPIERNRLWNEFVKEYNSSVDLVKANDTNLQKVFNFLKSNEQSPVMHFWDVPTFKALEDIEKNLDEQIDSLKRQKKLIKKIRDELGRY